MTRVWSTTTNNSSTFGQFVSVTWHIMPLQVAPPAVMPENVRQALALLQLSESYEAVALRSRYRAIAKEAHPDVGGETERMQAVNAARDLLHRWLGDGKPYILPNGQLVPRPT